MSRHDISGRKGAIIGPMLAKAGTETRGRKRKDDRLIFNAILWIMKTGAPWRDLHPEFGPWNTVHKRFLEWADWRSGMTSFCMLSINADPEAGELSMPPL
ncbi:transposase [Bilophila wadsworthia]|uniref:transposase n=1 Tax=Bilophila wadsworthia TaxID=35833 RepID=UPI003C6C2EFA